MARLRRKLIVAAISARVDGRTPFPLDVYARYSRTECTRPGYRSRDFAIDLGKAGRHWNGQTGKKDVIGPGERNCCHPGIAYVIVRCGRARRAWREGDLGVGDLESVGLVRRERNRRTGQKERRAGTGYSLRFEIGIEPDVIANLDGCAIEVGRI